MRHSWCAIARVLRQPGCQYVYVAGQSAYPESLMEPIAIACLLPPVERDDRLGARAAVAQRPGGRERTEEGHGRSSTSPPALRRARTPFPRGGGVPPVPSSISAWTRA
jgi:hypothetical protein